MLFGWFLWLLANFICLFYYLRWEIYVWVATIKKASTILRTVLKDARKLLTIIKLLGEKIIESASVDNLIYTWCLYVEIFRTIFYLELLLRAFAKLKSRQTQWLCLEFSLSAFIQQAEWARFFLTGALNLHFAA